MERVLMSNEKEYKNLVAVAKMLEATEEDSLEYRVSDCYLDFGSRLMWTTIIVHDPREDDKVLSSWQLLNPREWREITQAETIQELADIASRVR